MKLLTIRLSTGPSGIYFGLMNVLLQKAMPTAIISLQRTTFFPRFVQITWVPYLMAFVSNVVIFLLREGGGEHFSLF